MSLSLVTIPSVQSISIYFRIISTIYFHINYFCAIYSKGKGKFQTTNIQYNALPFHSLHRINHNSLQTHNFHPPYFNTDLTYHTYNLTPLSPPTQLLHKQQRKIQTQAPYEASIFYFPFFLPQLTSSHFRLPWLLTFSIDRV